MLGKVGIEQLSVVVGCENVTTEQKKKIISEVIFKLLNSDMQKGWDITKTEKLFECKLVYN